MNDSSNNLKRLTLEERQKIQSMLELGYSMHKIAKELERSHSCIRLEIQRSAKNGSYNAESAHQSFHDRNERKKEILRGIVPEEVIEHLKTLITNGTSVHAARIELGISYQKAVRLIQEHKITPNECITLEQRIERLEMQVEILTETIRELCQKH